MGGIVVFAIVKGVSSYAANSSQPLLSAPAKMVAKRMQVSRTSGDSMTHTHYYATFELETGERREYRVDGQEYGLLVEGDVGDLNFQGEWFKGFQRRM